MVKKYSHAEKSEWSHLVSAEDIDARSKTITFAADEAQLADLTRRLGVISVESAEARITVQKVSGEVIHAIGSATAHVTQNCVVTMAPVQSVLEEEFEGWFAGDTRTVSFARARSEREAKKGQLEAEILEESVDPEPIVNGKVDLGELATQYLCLAVDPYPHAPDAPTEFLATGLGKGGADGEAGAKLRKNPFEALKDWKEKR